MLKVWPESKKYLLLQKERVKISIPFGKKQIIEFQKVKRGFLNLRDLIVQTVTSVNDTNSEFFWKSACYL